MSKFETLIETLVADSRPVTPLAPPKWRALAWLGVVAAVGALSIFMLSDPRLLLARYPEREVLLGLELAAVLATGAIAITGAFFLSIPGASRRWLAAPLPPFVLWLTLSGIGCYAQLVEQVTAGSERGESSHCLLFILGVSALLAAPLIWRLSLARPIDPAPVALLGGLGTAALSAFLLAFFHPFTVTFLDLAVHLAAILIVVTGMALLGRRRLAGA